MAEPPLYGQLGEQLQSSICGNCWEEWKKTETMVINEHRLDFSVKEHRQFLVSQMKQFLNLVG